MPVNSVGEDVSYSSNKEIQYLLETPGDDFSVEFTGYIVEIIGRFRPKPDDDEELFKAVITNGRQRIPLLIWNPDSMTNVISLFVPNRILHLDGCQGHTVKPTKKSIEKNLINYEIIIQPGSVVEDKQFHVPAIVQRRVPMIKFAELAKVSGEFEVKTYIKTVVAPSYNRSGILSFGTGSITDGEHKVPIIVQGFKPNTADHLSKGLCVLVRGTVARTGNLRVICKDISQLKVLEKEDKLSQEVVQKSNKPFNRWDPKSDIEEVAAKRHCQRPALNDIVNLSSGKVDNQSVESIKMNVDMSYKESSF